MSLITLRNKLLVNSNKLAESGDCCCTDRGGWFDAYVGGTIVGGEPVAFQRTAAGMRPVGTYQVPSYYSRSNGFWSIDGDVVSLMSFTGFNYSSDVVWSLEGWKTSPTELRLSLYRTSIKHKEWSVPLDDINPQYRFPLSGSSEECAFDTGYVRGDVLKKIDTDGNITTVMNGWNSIKSAGSNWKERIVSFGAQDWPRACMLRWNAPLKKAEFIFGDMSTGGLINRTTVRSVENVYIDFFNIPAATSIDAFDSYDGKWVMALSYTLATPPLTTYYEVYINGVKVFNSTSNIINNNPWIKFAHCCYPPESSGGDWKLLYIVDPSKPNIDGYTPYKLSMWNGTIESWSLPRSTYSGDSNCYGSSDRWVYYSHWGTIAGTVAEEFTLTGGETSASEVLIRHDGSQVIPAGSMTNTYKQIDQGFTHPLKISTPFSDLNNYQIVRSSGTVPGSLPATYDEMWENRGYFL